MKILLTVFILSSVVSALSYALYQGDPGDHDVENVLGWSTLFALVSGVTAALLFIWS